jgi:hypothetical protein
MNDVCDGKEGSGGVDENNIHAYTCAFMHTRARTRKEAGKERKKEGRKRKKGRNKGTHLNFPMRMGTCRQGVRVVLVYLPFLGRTFSRCKQGRRRRKGGIAQESVEVKGCCPLHAVGEAAL